jgi:hypothetical protein
MQTDIITGNVPIEESGLLRWSCARLRFSPIYFLSSSPVGAATPKLVFQ